MGKLFKSIRNLIPSARYATILERNITARIDQLDYKNEYLFWMLQTVLANGDENMRRKVFLSMPKAIGYGRKVQLANAYLMGKLKDVCDRNGLHFVLMYGTLLGAVRHKGFIPWDDDIDVFMVRSDFLKLKEILRNDPELSLGNYYEPLRPIMPKVKFRGVTAFYVDVFTIDFMDVNEGNKDALLRESIDVHLEIHNKFKRELTARKIVGNKFVPIADSELDAIYDSMVEEALKKMPYFGHGSYFGPGLENCYYDRSRFGLMNVSDGFPLMENAMEFEGRMYDALKNYDKVLERLYGNIWQLPSSLSIAHSKETSIYTDAERRILQKIGLEE